MSLAFTWAYSENGKFNLTHIDKKAVTGIYIDYRPDALPFMPFVLRVEGMPPRGYADMQAAMVVAEAESHLAKPVAYVRPPRQRLQL